MMPAVHVLLVVRGVSGHAFVPLEAKSSTFVEVKINIILSSGFPFFFLSFYVTPPFCRPRSLSPLRSFRSRRPIDRCWCRKVIELLDVCASRYTYTVHCKCVRACILRQYPPSCTVSATAAEGN